MRKPERMIKNQMDWPEVVMIGLGILSLLLFMRFMILPLDESFVVDTHGVNRVY